MPDDPGVMAEKADIYHAQGKLQEAATCLSAINWQTASAFAFGSKINQLRFERNYAEAIRLLRDRLTQFRYGSKDDKAYDQVTLALMHRLAGDAAAANVTAEQTRDTLEHLHRDQPDNWKSAVILSQAYAAAGQKDSAIETAERAIMLLPRAKDPLKGPTIEENLARIQAMFGENSRAIANLSRLLQTPYVRLFLYSPTPITPALLRLDPLWDPLRADPAFQKLCEEKQP
jgi:serine/threonine-protein kinase